MKTDRYSDRVDITTAISLYEYGLIRNPETDRVIYCVNHGIEHTKEEPPIIKTTWISFEDVKDRLEDMDDDYGFFDYVSICKDTYIDGLDPNHIALDIFSIEQYDGTMELY